MLLRLREAIHMKKSAEANTRMWRVRVPCFAVSFSLRAARFLARSFGPVDPVTKPFGPKIGGPADVRLALLLRSFSFSTLCRRGLAVYATE